MKNESFGFENESVNGMELRIYISYVQCPDPVSKAELDNRNQRNQPFHLALHLFLFSKSNYTN